MRTQIIAGLILVGILFLVFGAYAQVPSINGQIAYTVCDWSPDPELSIQCDIWLMESDGTGQMNLTNSPTVNEMNPAWSPDGTKIAFIEGSNYMYRLMLINADGSGNTILTPEPSYQWGPTWSPGGTQIAFVRQLPGNTMSIQFDIVTLNVDGTGEYNLTNSDFDEVDPAWSPDGSKIAFAGVRFESTLDPVTGELITEAQWEIVTVNPDGTGEQVISAGDPGTSRAQMLEEDRSPAWSPDSSKLVFGSQSVDPCCDNWKILMVNRDGSNIILLSDNPDANDFAPSFSPDGTLIIFTSDRDATVGGEYDIYTIPVPTPLTTFVSSVTRLTANGSSRESDWGRKPDTTSKQQFPLFVSITKVEKKKGGKVKSSPNGIKCGKDCSEDFANGLQITLIAIPKPKFIFSGWTGACSAAGTSASCTVTMDDAKTVGALFIKIP